eukprot:sb/3472744/
MEHNDQQTPGKERTKRRREYHRTYYHRVRKHKTRKTPGDHHQLIANFPPSIALDNHAPTILQSLPDIGPLYDQTTNNNENNLERRVDNLEVRLEHVCRELQDLKELLRSFLIPALSSDQGQYEQEGGVLGEEGDVMGDMKGSVEEWKEEQDDICTKSEPCT